MPGRRQAAPVADLARRLHAIAIRLLRRARRDDVAMGLPPGQASALSVLVFGGPRTLSELARIEQVRAPTMTRMVAALEMRGLLRREPDPVDRRRTTLSASSAGTRLLHEGRARRLQILTDGLTGLGPRERALLDAALALLEALPAEPGPQAGGHAPAQRARRERRQRRSS